MKIQPIDSTTAECLEAVKIAPKSRLRRLFDFSNFLRGPADRSIAGDLQCGKDCGEDFEPITFGLDKMVLNFMESSSDKQSVTAGFKGCRRFSNIGNSDTSEDEFDSFNCFGNSSSTDACDLLKSLVLCETVFERNLLAEAAKIVDKNKICKRKDEVSRKIVADGLLAAGYDVSICKSRWEKTSTYPAGKNSNPCVHTRKFVSRGEYEYIAAVVEGDRLIIDIDFRSEFEIARSTKTYRAVLQMLPHIYVGKADRLQKIVNIVCDAAKQSLKKKGMPVPPWRKADYVKSKWLSPCLESTNSKAPATNPKLDAILTDEVVVVTKEEVSEVQWEPLEIKPKALKSGGKIIGGLASVIEGK